GRGRPQTRRAQSDHRCYFCQAEDGIRAVHVTGVQTCALPISWRAIAEDRPDGTHANEATVKLWAKGERIVATAEGNGPVNALDRDRKSVVRGRVEGAGGAGTSAGGARAPAGEGSGGETAHTTR